jgi:hypothetical protein
MHAPTSISSAERPARTGISGQVRKTLFRKLWLPRFVYEALPYLYMAVGFLSIYAAARMPGWTWILPYAFLLGIICVHTGLAIAALRYRFRFRSGKRRKRSTR